MSFKAGIGFIKQYLDKRAEETRYGMPLSWSGAVNNISKFDRDLENSTWNKLTSAAGGNKADIQRVLTKIAFCCAASRDLRRQFKGFGDNNRTPNDDRRRQAMEHKFIANTALAHSEHYLQ